MRKYYVKVSVIINLYLMGERLVNKRVYVPIPPIEKGVNEAVETLTEEVYDTIIQGIADSRIPCVEDLRVELLMESSSITARYENPLINEGEIFPSDSDILDDRIKYCMVKGEHELTKRLAYISKYLYE